MGRVKSFFHEAVEQETTTISVYILMQGLKPVGAYTDKDTADKDCWLCNEADKYTPEPMSYWVSSVPLCTDSPDEA